VMVPKALPAASLTRNGAVARASAAATGGLSALAIHDGCGMTDLSVYRVATSSLPPSPRSVRYSTHMPHEALPPKV